MTPKPQPLFNAGNLNPQQCPHCQTILYPHQTRAINCAHDLDPDRRRRPRGCLNRTDPATNAIPF